MATGFSSLGATRDLNKQSWRRDGVKMQLAGTEKRMETKGVEKATRSMSLKKNFFSHICYRTEGNE